MLDDMKKTWLARGLPKALQDVGFYAKGIDMAKIDERLKKLGECEPFS